MLKWSALVVIHFYGQMSDFPRNYRVVGELGICTDSKMCHWLVLKPVALGIN